MNRLAILTRPMVVVLCAAAGLVLVGGMVAYATWSVPSPAATVKARADAIAEGTQPIAVLRPKGIQVSWLASVTRAGVPARGYLVVRRGNGGQVQRVCGNVGQQTSCLDTTATAGTWRYSVQPVLGPRWLGAVSNLSKPVTISPPVAAQFQAGTPRPGTPRPGTPRAGQTTADPHTRAGTGQLPPPAQQAAPTAVPGPPTTGRSAEPPAAAVTETTAPTDAEPTAAPEPTDPGPAPVVPDPVGIGTTGGG